jgi:hypothetical protein
MVDNEENEPSKEPEDEEYEDSAGFDEMLYSLATALRAKRSKEAIAALIENYAAELPTRCRPTALQSNALVIRVHSAGAGFCRCPGVAEGH